MQDEWIGLKDSTPVGAPKFTGLVFFFIPGQVGAAERTYAFIFKNGRTARIRRLRSGVAATAPKPPRCRRWSGVSAAFLETLLKRHILLAPLHVHSKKHQ
jgi:hypothetical protein